MIFQRRSVLVLILVCLFVIFLNLKSEEPTPVDKNLSMPERIVVALYSPIMRGLNGVVTLLKSGYRHYVDLVGVRKMNEQLLEDLHWRETEIISLKERLHEASDRAHMLNDPGTAQHEGVPARVVAYDPLTSSQSVWINAGSKDGVAMDQPVIAAEGLVGRIIKVTANLSQVLLMADPHFSVDVLDAQTRVQVLVVGMGRNGAEVPHPPLMSHLEYLRLGSEIRVGDVLVTSGMGSLYPPGIPVGQVVSVENSGDGSFFKSSKVLPVVDFGKLEHVLVLTGAMKASLPEPAPKPAAPKTAGDKHP